MLILAEMSVAAAGSMLPIHRSFQPDLGPKSKVSLGIRKPRLEVNMTRGRPMMPPRKRATRT